MNLYANGKRKSPDVETAVFQYVTALVFLWLLSGFWQLQVQSPEIYSKRAEANRIKSIPILAPRGKILDRDGRIWVDNTPAFKVVLSRDSLDPRRLPLIAEGLRIPLGDLRERLERLRSSRAPEYQAIIVKENLSPGDIAFLEAHREELPELELIRSQRRLYPQHGLASHVVGYVGEISDAELDMDEFILYEPGAEIGKAGIERQYNDLLSGANGSRRVLVDSLSRRVRDLDDIVEAKPGHSLRLTLDLDLQVVAELAMQHRRGAVAAMDPRNGEILALVSTPNYDPNQFVGGIGAQDWRRLINDPSKPMMHRAIQNQLAPGSIFKPLVAMAALESGAVDPGFQIFCKGGAVHYGRYFSCHKRGGHGWVDLRQALVQSCDVYFYHVGKELGIDRIAEYSKRAGLGEKTGVDLPHEQEGTVPSSTWKVRKYREKWYAGETISVSIGQGALTTTPLQITSALAGLAVGGVWHEPHVVGFDDLRELRPGFEPPAPRRMELRPRTVETIRRALWGVVNDGGTGARARLPGVAVCGKTGTAQRISNKLALTKNDPAYFDDAWFVGYAPCENPEIIVTALFENGEHGHFAAPIVRDVIKAYFDKKLRMEWTRRRQQSQPPRLDFDTPHLPVSASISGGPLTAGAVQP